MRLLRNVERLEAGVQAAAAAAERAAAGPPRMLLCWTDSEERVDARKLGRGDFIACDVALLPLAEAPTLQVRMVERVTRDVGDLGVVRSAAGVRVGRVTAIDGESVEWELDPGLSRWFWGEDGELLPVWLPEASG